MVVFPWGAIVASNANAARRARERREEQEKLERERKEKEQREQPFKNKIVKFFHQIEIYPIYAYKLEEVYKTEENGQINCLETVYKSVEVIKGYYVNDGWNTAEKIEKFFKNYWQIIK